MNRLRIFLALTVISLSCTAVQSLAQSVQSARPVKINTIITADDLVLTTDQVSGSFERIEDAVGLETRKTLYPGRPVMVGDLGPITVIERNQLVRLLFELGALKITADGRSLGRASLGQRVQVMNSDSRLIVTGVVTSPTSVEVQN